MGVQTCKRPFVFVALSCFRLLLPLPSRLTYFILNCSGFSFKQPQREISVASAAKCYLVFTSLRHRRLKLSSFCPVSNLSLVFLRYSYRNIPVRFVRCSPGRTVGDAQQVPVWHWQAQSIHQVVAEGLNGQVATAQQKKDLCSSVHQLHKHFFKTCCFLPPPMCATQWYKALQSRKTSRSRPCQGLKQAL